MRRLMTVAALLTAALSAATAADAVAQIEVDLSVVEGRYVVTAFTPDGVELPFALSTANGATVLTETGAAIIENHGDPTFGGVAIEMGSPSIVGDGDLSSDGSIVGMIGSNTLNQFDILVDVPGGRLLLKDPGPPVQWDGMTLSDPTPLRVFHGMVLTFSVDVNGTTYPASLDLGTPVTLANAPVKAALALSDEDDIDLALGTVSFPETPVRVSDNPVLQRFDQGGTGFVFVGGSFARDCAVSISWVRREMRTCVR